MPRPAQPEPGVVPAPPAPAAAAVPPATPPAAAAPSAGEPPRVAAQEPAPLEAAIVTGEPEPAAAPPRSALREPRFRAAIVTAPDPASRPAPDTDRTASTAPQLRRFIKSRAYVPMHELRRRFAIESEDDDVTAVDMHGGRIYVGLPTREGHLLGELFRAGDVGYELSMDPVTPIVVGVFPMRPVPRA